MKIKQWIVQSIFLGQILLIQKNAFANDKITIYDKNWNRTGEIKQKTKDSYTEYGKNWDVKKYYKIDNGKINMYDKNWNRVKELKDK